MSRIVQINNQTKGLAFVRLVLAQAIEARGENAEAFASKRWGDDALATQVIRAGGSELLMVEKASVAAGGRASGNWAHLLVATDGAAAEFFALVRDRSLLGRIPGLRTVPLMTRLLATSTGFNAAWVGDGQPVPVSSAAFSETSIPPRKVAALGVVTQELMVSDDPNAEAFILADLVAAVSSAIDATFIDPTNAGTSGVKPASITYGAPSIPPALTPVDNLKLLIDAFPGDLERAVLVGSPKTFATFHDGFSLPGVGPRGGEMMGLPAIPSTAAGDTLALIDPTGIAWGGGAVTTKVATEASIEMLDNPTNASATGTPTSLVSLWQTNAAAIMAECVTNWTVARPSVTIAEGVAQS